MTDVQWNDLRPILQDITDRLARIEQFMAASGLQAPAQLDNFHGFDTPGQVHDAGPMQTFSPPQASMPAAVQVPDYIVAMVQSGNAVKAIKEYRNATGVSLKEAKSVIDQLAAGGF